MHGVSSDRIELRDRVAVGQSRGQQPNSLVSAFDQVVDGTPRRADIVDEHRVGRQAPSRTVDLHDREPAGLDGFEMPGLMQLGRREEEAVDSPLQHRLDGAAARQGRLRRDARAWPSGIVPCPRRRDGS